MKKITDAQAQNIYDFSQEAENSLPAYVLEKDVHVLDALKIINGMPANSYFGLVFCGGTCLSKAYGILERMSEDIDFKVVPNEVGLKLSRTEKRKALRDFAESTKAALMNGGFVGDNAIIRESKNEGTCNTLTISYESAFEKPTSLRSQLLIEMIFATLSKPASKRDVGLLLDRLASGSYAKPFDLPCVSLEEAFSEKMVSFPRRLGLHFAKQSPAAPGARQIVFDDKLLTEEFNWDQSLVRHLFDVKALSTSRPDLLENMNMFGRLFSTTVSGDAVSWKKQYQEFESDPVSHLMEAMAFAKSSETLRQQYDKFIEDMVYGGVRPSYDDAHSNFTSILNAACSSVGFQNAIKGDMAFVRGGVGQESGGPVH
jgi:hypothetical protein